MVDYTFSQLIQTRQLNLAEISDIELTNIWEEVYQFWASPSLDPATPPPHSTGAAVDITLVDRDGKPVDMGSAIDEVSPISAPDYFANSINYLEQQYHFNRQLLGNIMQKAGFQRHQNEWWHFSFGDQMWAWLCNQANPNYPVIARYGKAL